MARRIGTKVASCFNATEYDDDDESDVKLMTKMNLMKRQKEISGGFDSVQLNVGRHFTGNSSMRNLHSFKNQLKDMQNERSRNAMTVNTQFNSSGAHGNTQMVYGHAQTGLGIDGTVTGHNISGISPSSNKNELADVKYDPQEDKNTTNLYICGINPDILDKDLITENNFGKYGAIASVKILYPKTEDERIKNRGRGNSGFISYMTRDNAEEAKLEMNDKNLKNYKLKVAWAKSIKNLPYMPVSLPEVLKPIILPANNVELEYDFPFNAISSNHSNKFRDSTIKVTYPLDKKIHILINRTIEFIIKFGPKFEIDLANKEINNIAFKFLNDYNSSEHIYYRWRLYSLLHGESTENWSEKPFKMFMMGPWWKPPPINKWKVPGQKERITKLRHLVENSKSSFLSSQELQKQIQDGLAHNEYKESVLPDRFNTVFNIFDLRYFM